MNAKVYEGAQMDLSWNGEGGFPLSEPAALE